MSAPHAHAHLHAHFGQSEAAAADVDEASPLLGETDFSSVDVYELIHEIRVDVVSHIDTPLTYEQIIAPDSTYTIVRPLTEKYLNRRNPSVVFCLLLNKVQFTSDSAQLSINTLSLSRATLCEVLAQRVLRGWSERSLHLATVLLTPWPLFQGAPAEVIKAVKDEGEDDLLDDSGTALEMAIISSSKRFIRAPSCQKVIEGIWSGKIVYSVVSAHAFISDNYKRRPIQIYNPHKAPLLDHYRLKVPKFRAALEYCNFVVLFMLYIVAIERLDHDHINGTELAFIIYAVAFSLDKAAAIREHGLKVFSSSLVNGFDMGFVIIFNVYFATRLYGFYYHDLKVIEFGSDLLAVGAVFMFPRMAFMTLANNLMVLSLRSMLSEFTFLMSLGIFCFIGFVYALRTLAQGSIPVSQICWWLLEVYFGLDATGFESAHEFHKYLGPLLMIIYGFLSNTLLLTVLVAILGNTFATINADAAAESMFRKAVATVEGVKADAVFSYQLPFNILAILTLYPLSVVLNPRWFHKINVLAIRATNLPVLLLIGLYERQTYNKASLWEQTKDFVDRYAGKLSAATGFEGLVGARMDISAVFEIEREYGTYYQGWAEDGGDEDEEVENNDEAIEYDASDEEESTTESHTLPVITEGQITDSPTSERFSVSSTPVGLRHRRRNSTNHLSTPLPVGIVLSAVPPPAPLPRVRRNSTYTPSPLAQLFVRHDEAVARWGSAHGVGSMPPTSSIPPHRHVMAHRASSGSGTATSPSQASTGLGLSRSVGPAATLSERPSFARPSVMPIQEVPSPDSPSTPDIPQRKEPSVRPKGSLPFPPLVEDTTGQVPTRRAVSESRPRLVSFKDEPSSAQQSSQPTTPTAQISGADRPQDPTAVPPPVAAPVAPANLTRRPSGIAKSASASNLKTENLTVPDSNLSGHSSAPQTPRLGARRLPSPSASRTPSGAGGGRSVAAACGVKASDLLESHNNEPSPTTLENQLAAMEARQKKIEAMLEKLCGGMLPTDQRDQRDDSVSARRERAGYGSKAIQIYRGARDEQQYDTFGDR